MIKLCVEVTILITLHKKMRTALVLFLYFFCKLLLLYNASNET
ncbi:Uncharacterised protein [Klebsiella variicola]|nr:Uncharacterised protein [Klebsiella variicola]